MSSFAEIQFPPDISYGATGGPIFSTDIVTTFSGHEQRNINWAQARAKYNVATGIKSESQWRTLIAFFRARRGRAIGFRFKDWSDYQGVAEPIALGDGVTTAFQLIKIYSSGDTAIARPISKPVAGSVNIYVDAVLQESGVTVDSTNGVITFDVAPADEAEITADFEFDVPVRFDTDELDLSIESFDAGRWSGIPLIEIRI
jgi:uncharacterized protein (TIGR02217 family)